MNTQKGWNDRWIQAQERTNTSGGKHECWHTWNTESAARSFAAGIDKSAVKERIADLKALLPSAGKALDIGAGPGTIAVPLAQTASLVTAVEPAEGMAAVLREQAINAGVKNITLLQKRWDDVLPDDLEPPYDVTFASFSLGMRDLRASLQKMNAVTSGYIVIYWHYGEQPWEEDSRALWPLLHGHEFIPVPKSDLVCRVLDETGIKYTSHVIERDSMRLFASFGEALEQFARRYEANEEYKKKLLSDYLADRLVKQGEQFILPRRERSMRIQWKAEHS